MGQAFAEVPDLQPNVLVVTSEIRVVDYGWGNERTIPKDTVVKRAKDEDPNWWSDGVAIEVPFSEGDKSGWKTVYTAKSNWEEGLREKRVTEFVDPDKAFKTVEEAVKAVTSEDCENNEVVAEQVIKVYENEREAELMSKVKPVENSFADLMDIVNKAESRRSCNRKVRDYFKNKSPWSSLSVKERAELMDIKSKATFNKIKEEGKETLERDEFGRFQDLCKNKVATKEAERIKIYAKSATDHSVAEALKKFQTKIGSKSNRVWVKSLGDLYNTAIQDIPVAVEQKVMANLNIDEEGKEIAKEQLSRITLPSSEEFVKRIERQFRGYTNLSSRDVRNFIVDNISSAYMPFVKEHVSQITTEMEKVLFSDEVKDKYKGIKRHGKFCFQLVGEMYNKGETTIPLEAINALEPVLTPGLPVEDKKRKFLNPHVMHKDLNATVAMCIARTETGVDDLNPNSLNYTYCGNVGTTRGNRKYNPSTATGFDHTVVKTINHLRKTGLLPLSTMPEAKDLDTDNYLDNKKLNELKANNIDSQFEISLRHMNYLMKKGHTKKTRNKTLSGDLPEAVEIAIIHYDQDNESDYVKTFTRCYNCIQDEVANGESTVEECMSPTNFWDF